MEDHSCGICLSSVRTNKYKLDCGHEFHQKCLTPWLLEKNTCPLCRNISYDIDTDLEGDEEYPRYIVMLPNNVNNFGEISNRIDDLICILELNSEPYYKWSKNNKGAYITKFSVKNIQTILSIDMYIGDEPNSIYLYPSILTKFMHKISYIKNDKWKMKNKYQNRFKSSIR